MTLPTFTPPCNPSPGFTNTPEIKIRKTEFGDGYTQESPAGLNHVRVSRSRPFRGMYSRRTNAISAIIAFFTERGGTKPFSYAFPHDPVRKWTVPTWSDQAISGGFHRVTATFRQSFVSAGLTPCSPLPRSTASKPAATATTPSPAPSSLREG